MNSNFTCEEEIHRGVGLSTCNNFDVTVIAVRTFCSPSLLANGTKMKWKRVFFSQASFGSVDQDCLYATPMPKIRGDKRKNEQAVLEMSR